MKTSEITIPNLAFKAAFFICGSCITYFMVMIFFNLIHVAELRFLNIFILIAGLYIAFRYYRLQTKILNIAYLEGLLLGILITGISFFSFALFIYIYFSSIDASLLQELKNNTLMMGDSLTAFSAALTVFVEGMFAGGVITFILMQYYQSGFYRTIQEKRQAGIQV